MDARTTDVSLQADYGYAAQPEYGQVSGARPSIGIGDILNALRRDWRFPVGGLLIGLIVGVGFVTVVKTPYKSTARLLIDRSMNRFLQTNKIIDQPTLDDTEIGSQLYLLSSDSVVVPVVRSMRLAQDSEFVGNLAGAVAADFSGAAAPDPVAERTAVEAVLRRLTVNREDVANVISLTFESQDPNKAADVANAIAETYIDTTLQTKLKSTKIVSDWLQERLTELKKQAITAERALQEYKDANKLSDTGTGPQNAERLASLRNQLANARIAVAEAKERFERILRAPPDGISNLMATDALVNTSRASVISFALNNSDLVRLRAQHRELAARAAEIESRVGPNHFAARKVREQVESVRSAIASEEQRIADAYASEYQVAKAREGELAASAAEMSGEAETSSQLRELEGAAETLRNLQNAFLQKYKEINSAQTETLPVQNAHIISKGVPPLYKSSKKALALFGGSVLAGLFLGIGAAVGREWLADVFRSPKAVEQVTGTECVTLPLVEGWSGLIEEHLVSAPCSRFAEALRNVKASIDLNPGRGGAKVIGILSAAPKEGKTVVAANLAALMVMSSGARTLVIDSDLHLRKLTDALAPEAHEGLIEALEDPRRLDALVVKRRGSGVDVLPCVSRSRIPNAAELLGSPKMERLLAAARESYDYIVIEIAPIMSVIDVKMIERQVDEFVFVVEWGVTKRTLVVDAIAYAHVIRDRLVTMVLNKVDKDALRTIESYKGSRSADYYEE